ncbi:MAG: hypothetical protein ACE5KM_24480, partial [Planctomycetaceae bacterium]
MMLRVLSRWVLAAALAVAVETPGFSKKPGVAPARRGHRPVVVPQVGVGHMSKRATVTIERVAADAVVHDATAVTTLTILLRAVRSRTAGSRAAGFTPAVPCDVLVPLPKDARVLSCRRLPQTGKTSPKSTELHFKTLSGRSAAMLLRKSVETSGSAALLEFYGYPFVVVSDVAVPSTGTTIAVTYQQPAT